MECLNSFDCHDHEEKVLFFIICNKEEKEDKKTGGIPRILKDWYVTGATSSIW